MRLSALPRPSGDHEWPLWPPLLATRGIGSLSDSHAHHAMHLVLARKGTLRIRALPAGRWHTAAGVLTAPDLAHALDAREREVLLVFIDPESDAGQSLRSSMNGPFTLISPKQRDTLEQSADPMRIMQADGVDFVRRVVDTLGAPTLAATRAMHPRVRKALRLLKTETTRFSLEALAAAVDLSPGRLMHAFTESIGIPLRPYLSWLRMQRAAAAIVSGQSLSAAAAEAGFSDSAHMTRTFRSTFGMTPSMLRPSK